MDDLLLIHFIEGKTSKDETLSVLHWIEKSDTNKKYFVKTQIMWTAIEILRGLQ